MVARVEKGFDLGACGAEQRAHDAAALRAFEDRVDAGEALGPGSAKEFGEHTRFEVTSDLLLGVSRSFRSFTDALEEVKNARIFSGIHFRTACDDGTTLGKSVAQYVLDHNFQRLH